MANNKMLNAALKYAKLGYPVFPLNGKIPAIKGGKGCHDATTDEKQIREWWEGKYKTCNIGLATGATSGIWVLDIDVGDGKSGQEKLEDLLQKHGELPQTPTQVTGSGGHHYLFKLNGENIKNSTSKIAPNIDTKADGGYIVVSPSRHPDTKQEYKWKDALALWEIAPVKAPSWLEEKARKHEESSSPVIPVSDSENVFPKNYVLKALENECQKITAAGNGKQETTLNNASYSIGQLIDASDLDCLKAVDALTTAAGQMHSYKKPWTNAEIIKKITHGLNDGMKNPRQPNKPANDNDEAITSNVNPQISELNKQHAIVMLGGKCVILKEILDPITKWKDVIFSIAADFRTMNCNREIKVKGAPKKLGQAWLESPDRRQYEGIDFSPDGLPENFYNLYQGFLVKPKKGDCSLYLSHIEQVICGDDEELYDYVLNLMADAVQNPGTRPGVAIVLRGDQGVGKGVFVENFGKLFGPHFISISSAKHLTGNFNSHLKDKLIVFADEAVWAGDKSAEGILKAMITEKTHIIEMKGKDAFSVRNYIRLFIASNNDWVVPAGRSERRFCVIDVQDTHKQDHTYFGAIQDQMDNGGLEALLDLLLKRDIQDVNLRAFPKTTALVDQQIHTLDPFRLFIHEVLVRGYFEEIIGWDELISMEKIEYKFGKFMRRRNQKSYLSTSQIGKELNKIFPNLSLKRPKGNGLRKRKYKFPSLDECRKTFEKATGIKIEGEEGKEGKEGKFELLNRTTSHEEKKKRLKKLMVSA